jgi:hypothetical protein
MDGSSKSARTADWLWFLAWGLASSLWCCAAARELGATFDEPVYITQGLEAWRCGSHQGLIKLGTMPLPIDLETLPLYLWERWHGIQLDPNTDLPRLLPWARAGTLAFWWVLLLYGRLAGRQLAGPWGGRLAVALLACEPSLLAHASLATTDIAVTACLLALVYHFQTGRTNSWFWRIGVPAFWFGAAVLAKASGLVFGGICLVAVELDRLFTARWGRHGTRDTVHEPLVRPVLREVLQITTLGLLITFLYCGCDWRPEPSFLQWARQLPDGPVSRIMVWLAEHLRIFSNAGEGLVRQIRHNVRGHGSFLLGHVADRALWYYFPVAISMKVTAPLLVLFSGLLILRPRALWNWAGQSTLALTLLSLTCRVQIGIRLLLPLIALAIVAIAAATARVASRGGVRVADESLATPALPSALGSRPSGLATVRPRQLIQRAWTPLLILLVSGCLLWSEVAAFKVWPNGLCYINEFWGGTEQGYLVLSDSNYDWGQGLPELVRWQQGQGGPPVDVWYFGMDPSLDGSALHELRLHTLPIDRPEDVSGYVEGHYLAVSTTLLHGSVITTLRAGSAEARAYRAAMHFLRGHRPTARTTTFLIYDFTYIRAAARGPSRPGGG